VRRKNSKNFVQQQTLIEKVKESHDSPRLPEHLRKEDILYAGHAEDIIQPAVRLGWQFVEDDYVDDGIIDWDHAIADATKFLKKKGHTVAYT